uniref:hypothetical protein n=1 Tax=Candidatus Scatousia sp. TaxID=3085663 RepID=UPI0040292FCF
MKKFPASGAIGMLLTMLIIALLFILMMPALQNSGSTNLKQSPINKHSVEQEVNQKLEEIQNLRNQSMQLPTEEY